MIVHRALRRPAAALFLVPLMAAGACSAGDESAPPETGDHSDAAGGGHGGDGNGGGNDDGGVDQLGEATSAPSPGLDDDGDPITEDTSPEPAFVDADAIQFDLGGTQMLCWADADDGSADSVFGCQGAAGWVATEGLSPASVLLFSVDDDGATEVKALQANAPVTAWEIQGVRPGGRYVLGDATIDLTDRERLTFAVEVEDEDNDGGDEGNDGDGATGGDRAKTSKSGWVTVDDYGWDE